MFKHITTHPWILGTSGMTVWGYRDLEQYGQPLVAESKNRNMPILTKRANARLISIAPQMFEIIRGMTNNEEAQMLVRYMEKEVEDESQTTE